MTAHLRVVLGMTLHNNARHLREATGSVLGQRYRDFALVMLDDASADETEDISRSVAQRDPRVHYHRHPTRQGMVPTWREVVRLASAAFPAAEYFAWVSDHDRWHSEWLGEMVAALDANPAVVLVYPITQRMDEDGTAIEKEPRSFQTLGMTDPVARWRAFCHDGVGSGDMVYGLMRLPALTAAGTFRDVLNPDRLLVAELTLQGEILQVQAPLWSRRRAAVASIARQRLTLFAGPPPPWFGWPATLQHAWMIYREYVQAAAPPVRVAPMRLLWMLTSYQVTSLWRLFRKTDASKSLGRGVDHAYFVKKLLKKGVLLSLHYTLIGINRSRSRLRRWRRLAVYESLMSFHRVVAKVRRLGRLTRYKVGSVSHRLGLRGPGGARPS
jgi:glycosyltransferase involved in cell wall biosynthesis